MFSLPRKLFTFWILHNFETVCGISTVDVHPRTTRDLSVLKMSVIFARQLRLKTIFLLLCNEISKIKKKQSLQCWVILTFKTPQTSHLNANLNTEERSLSPALFSVPHLSCLDYHFKIGSAVSIFPSSCIYSLVWSQPSLKKC